MKVRPMGMLLMMLAGWIDQHQQDVITLYSTSRVLSRELSRKNVRAVKT